MTEIISANMKKVILLGLLQLIFLGSANADNTARLLDPAAPFVFTTNNLTSFILITEGDSSDPIAESNALAVYVPIRSHGGAAGTPSDSAQYSRYTNPNNLPGVSVASASTMTINMEVTNNTGNKAFLLVAVKGADSTKFEVTHRIREIVDGNINSATTTTLSLNGLCSNSNFNCDSIEEGDAAQATANRMVYIYLDTTDQGIGQEINPTSHSSTGNGIFLDVFLSNNINQSNTITQTELRKGDARLTSVFQGFNAAHHLKTNAFDYTGTADCTAAGQPGTQEFQNELGKGVEKDLDSTINDGEVNIKDLVNGVEKRFSIYFVNRLNFASDFSNGVGGTPLEIEALLESQSCYIFSAGFTEEHPVTNYFQAFRDEHLKTNALGKIFVNWYYKTAPQYTPYILKTPWLQKLIRGFAYFMFYFMQLFPWILALTFAVLTVLTVVRRKQRHDPV